MTAWHELSARRSRWDRAGRVRRNTASSTSVPLRSSETRFPACVAMNVESLVVGMFVGEPKERAVSAEHLVRVSRTLSSLSVLLKFA